VLLRKKKLIHEMISMEKVKIVKRNEIDIQRVFNEIRKTTHAVECGAIVSFLGIIRGIGHDEAKVKKVIYEADFDFALKNLKEIRRRLLDKYPDVKDLYIYHVVDEMNVGDSSILIVAISGHRQQAFKAVEDAINIIKKETPIWKKEITEKGEYWISEEEIIKINKKDFTRIEKRKANKIF